MSASFSIWQKIEVDILLCQNVFMYIVVRARSMKGVCKTDLARSPEIRNGSIGLTVLWNKASAASAYSKAIEAATAEVLVFAHCDVYFPEGWFKRLAWEVDRLSHLDRDWAVAGVSSITPSGELVDNI